MSIFKDKIDFDPTVPADIDRIGAFNIGKGGAVVDSQTINSLEWLNTASALFDGSGTALTSTLISGDQALDVNIATASVTVDASDLDIRDIVHTQDSIAIGDGTAVILDIQALDSAAAGTETTIMMSGIRQDAAGSPVSADGDVHPFLFNNDGELKVKADSTISSDVADDAPSTENPILTGGVAHAASAALTALSADGDKGHILMDLYRRQYVRHSANISIKNSNATVGVAAAELAATPHPGRVSIEIQNRGTKSIYIGFDATVTTANGLEVPKFSTWEKDLGEAINIFAISGTAGQDVRILEAA